MFDSLQNFPDVAEVFMPGVTKDDYVFKISGCKGI